MKYKNEIEKYIEDHKQEMIDDIIKLCEINSQKMPYKEGMPFGEGPYKALMAAISMGEGYGFSVKNYDNYVAAIDLNDKEKGLDILAHLDVVPEGEGWTKTEPFKPHIEDGKIYGRGTSDDKGPAVAALYALRALKELNIPLSKNVRLILGTDEECGSECIKHYYKFEKEAPLSFSPDAEYPVVNIEKGKLHGNFVANFEKSTELPRIVSIEAGTKVNVVPPKAKVVIEGLKIDDVKAEADKVSAETGIKFLFDLEPVFEITAMGKNAHGSTPQNGNNAITALLLLISRLKFAKSKQIEILNNLYKLMPHGETDGKSLGIKCSDEKSGELTLAFSLLKVTQGNIDGGFDLRCPICASTKDIMSTLRAKLSTAGVELTNQTMTEPHEVPGDGHFVQTLNKCYEEYTGLKGGAIAIGGLTYVHDIKNGVAFGAIFPGTDTHMHGADEFMVISELVASAKIFAQVIVELCS